MHILVLRVRGRVHGWKNNVARSKRFFKLLLDRPRTEALIEYLESGEGQWILTTCRKLIVIFAKSIVPALELLCTLTLYLSLTRTWLWGPVCLGLLTTLTVLLFIRWLISELVPTVRAEELLQIMGLGTSMCQSWNLSPVSPLVYWLEFSVAVLLRDVEKNTLQRQVSAEIRGFLLRCINVYLSPDLGLLVLSFCSPNDIRKEPLVLLEHIVCPSGLLITGRMVLYILLTRIQLHHRSRMCDLILAFVSPSVEKSAEGSELGLDG
jgi:hypothetical protein